MHNNDNSYYTPSWSAVDDWIRNEELKANVSDYPYGWGDLDRHHKTPGAYALYFPDSKYIYFGSSSNLYKTRKQHIHNLSSNQHLNKELQEVFNNSDNKAFMFFYIKASNRHEAIELEQKFLDDYSDHPKLINKCKSIIKSLSLINIDNAYKIIDKFTDYMYKRKYMEKVSEELKPTKTITKGIVFYSDGSAAPTNPGFIGWGVHGYLFENEVPKKGAGNLTHILTSSGYVPKVEKATTAFMEVKPLKYFDFFGSSLDKGSNNVAELEGARNALVKANEYDIDSVAIYTDSEYVRRGIDEWSPTWIKRNWIKSDGTPVPNSSYWKQLIFEIDTLKNKGVDVKIFWVKGHNDILGNTIADKLASIGSVYSGKNQVRVEYNVSEVDGYWKSITEKHPFISNKRMYFNTSLESQVAGEYYLGDHGSDDYLMGKRDSDAAYSVVQLVEPDPIIEKLRKYQSNIACDIDSLINVRLDKLFSPDVYSEIIKYEDGAFVRANSYSLDLNCLDGKPLTKELRPARLSMRTITAIAFLRDRLILFRECELNKDVINTRLDNFKIQDITDVFYEKEVKVKKKVEETILKLKARYNVGFDNLKIDTHVTKDDKPHPLSVSLSLGIDLPDRNGLKKLEEMNPQFYLITWNESPKTIRYAVVGKSEDSYGIWAGMHSNLIFI
jgi:ribonuclease HI